MLFIKISRSNADQSRSGQQLDVNAIFVVLIEEPGLFSLLAKLTLGAIELAPVAYWTGARFDGEVPAVGEAPHE